MLSVDSFVVLRELALQGAGATLLPGFMADGDDRLQRLHELPRDPSAGLWLLTHVDLRHTRRVTAFMEHVARSVRAAMPDRG